MNSRNWSSIVLVALLVLSSIIPPVQATEPMSDSADRLLDDYVEDESSLTWVDCWAGNNAGDMDAENQSFCATNYAEAPSSRLYGIRWVYLNVSADDVPADWTEVQINNLNAVFGKWNFQFATAEEIVIPDAVAESDDYYDEWTVQEFMPDLRAQLNLSSDDATALSELKEQLAARHVSQEHLDNLTLDDEYNTGLAFRIASRARSEHITVIVRPNLEAGGKSGGPHAEFQSLLGAAVELNSNLLTNGNLVTLPHEMGHYFGVSHTHVANYDEAEAEFDYDNLVGRMEFGGDAIRRIVGDDYSQPFGEPWPMFNGSSQDFDEFQQLLSEALVWPAWQMAYHGDHQNFDNLGQFMAMGEADEPIYRKNFKRNYEFGDGHSNWFGYNCFWNETLIKGQCKYHDPPAFYSYDHPSMAESMWFENGTVSNLMSYITPPYEDVSSRAGLSSNQIDKMKFSANTPMRQLLRNYCIGTDLCEEAEELECTPGDTQPAEDGCNTCACNSEGVWICTLMGCPDEGEENETEEEELPCTPGDTMPAEDGCNNCICTDQEEWACTMIYCPDNVSLIPRISMWPGKVNQHNVNGTWLTDPDGVSGGHPSSDYPYDYGDRKLEYCQKFWPDTTSVNLLPDKETITFYTEGNNVAYTSSKDVYQCVGANNTAQFNDTGTDDDDTSKTDDVEVIDNPIPGFGLTALLSMLAIVAIIRRRQNGF